MAFRHSSGSDKLLSLISCDGLRELCARKSPYEKFTLHCAWPNIVSQNFHFMPCGVVDQTSSHMSYGPCRADDVILHRVGWPSASSHGSIT
jgi:hypothetical protein